jgi:hypothetical protein
VTLALCMLVTALYLAPQPVGAEEAEPFDLAKAIRDAKIPAEHEAIASYYNRAATAAYTQAAEYRKIAEAYRNISGKGQFRIEGRYRELAQYYKGRRQPIVRNGPLSQVTRWRPWGSERPCAHSPLRPSQSPVP